MLHRKQQHLTPLDSIIARCKNRCMASPLTEQRVRAALELAGGNRQKAADLLGINRVTLWRQMRRLGIEATWRLPTHDGDLPGGKSAA